LDRVRRRLCAYTALDDRAIMQKFEYRTPRFSVDLPVRFTVEKLTLTGRCREISQEGMTFETRQPLTPGSSGVVSIGYQDRTIEIHARVAHVTEMQSGLEFLYESEAERSAVAQLVASLASSQNRQGPVLLH
jgi:hypothetical protein